MPIYYSDHLPEAVCLQLPLTMSDGNERMFQAEVLSYGATLSRFLVPMKNGEVRDIVLGPCTLDLYKQQDKYFGAVVGRVSNRIGGASFELNGKKYQLEANNSSNNLHGGHPGFHEVTWNVDKQGFTDVTLSYTAKDMEAGFPGNLKVKVRYSLYQDGEDTVSLKIDYSAVSDEDTICAMTQHSYFNLNGQQDGTLTGHTLKVNATKYTVLDENSTPTGELADVSGTALDFREEKNLSEVLSRYGMVDKNLIQGKGIDHNFCLSDNAKRDEAEIAAILENDDLHLECLTTLPGIQVYTANYLDGDPGKPYINDNGMPVMVLYAPQSGVCLEAQYWPDAVHHNDFPSIVLKKGEEYRHQTIYKLKIK